MLHNRVCWKQRSSRENIMSALMLVQVVAVLHQQWGPARITKADDSARGLQKIMGNVGKNVFRDNIRTFFDLLDEQWGIRRIAYKEGATHVRRNFMWCLADILGGYENFWRDKRLNVEKSLRTKIGMFELQDPMIKELCNSGGSSSKVLYQLMVNHINSGKRTKHLVPIDRAALPDGEAALDDSEDSAKEEAES